MSLFSTRERKLIAYLSKRDTWVSSNEIISYLGISLRTLRNTVKNINSNHKYIISSYKGYRIIENAKTIEELLQTIHHSENDSNEDREKTVLKRLLLSKEPLDYFSLSNTLFISEQTLLSSITSLNKKIAPYNVTIIKRGDTISLKGDEINIRRLFCDTVYKEVEEKRFYVTVLDEFFSDIDVVEIKNIVAKIVSDSNFEINDYALNSIVLHICVIVDRRKYEISYEDSEKSIINENNPQFLCAIKIVEWLEKNYDLKRNYNDFNVIYSLLLIGMKESYSSYYYENISNIIDSSIFRFVKTVIVKVYNEYFINLDNDEFIINFAMHLNNIINRKMSLRNPMLTSIKDSYPTIYEIAVFIAKQIQDKYPLVNMDDHQISYIALHVGTQIEKQALSKIKTYVINPEYLKLNSLILSKLEANFSNVLSLTIVSDDDELNEIDISETDLIISTIPLAKHYECKTVYVSVFINQNDIKNIFDAINEIKNKSNLDNEYLLEYFDGTFNYFDNNVNNYEDVIKIMCETHGNLDEDFLTRVMIREEMSPSEYMNIAVIHPIQCDEKETFISVGIFKRTFKWRKNDVNIVFLLSVSQKDKNKFLKILRQLIEIFSSRKWMEEHSTINSYEKFIKFIKEYNTNN